MNAADAGGAEYDGRDSTAGARGVEDAVGGEYECAGCGAEAVPGGHLSPATSVRHLDMLRSWLSVELRTSFVPCFP